LGEGFFAGAAGFVSGVLAETGSEGADAGVPVSVLPCVLSCSQPFLRDSEGYSEVYQPDPLRMKPELAEIVWMASKVTPHSSQMCLKSGKLFKIGEKNDY